MIRRLLELIRFSHTVFALPFALLSAILAWTVEPFRWLDLTGILLSMVLARSAAMAFNRLIDRRYDAANPRTANRHLVVGSLSVVTVTLFTVVCAVGFLASTLLFTLREPPNWWPAYLAGPVLGFVLAYSLTKRFTSLSHFWLGASLMLAPLAAWIAIRGPVELSVPALLGLAVLAWVSGFDILYACQDVDFDRSAGLHSLPARVGITAALQLAAACHVGMVVVLATLPLIEPALRGWVYGLGLVTTGILLIYEHAIVRPDDLTRVNRAFFQVNGIISVGLLLTVLAQLAMR